MKDENNTLSLITALWREELEGLEVWESLICFFYSWVERLWLTLESWFLKQPTTCTVAALDKVATAGRQDKCEQTFISLLPPSIFSILQPCFPASLLTPRRVEGWVKCCNTDGFSAAWKKEQESQYRSCKDSDLLEVSKCIIVLVNNTHLIHTLEKYIFLRDLLDLS